MCRSRKLWNIQRKYLGHREMQIVAPVVEPVRYRHDVVHVVEQAGLGHRRVTLNVDLAMEVVCFEKRVVLAEERDTIVFVNTMGEKLNP